MCESIRKFELIHAPGLAQLDISPAQVLVHIAGRRRKIGRRGVRRDRRFGAARTRLSSSTSPWYANADARSRSIASSRAASTRFLRVCSSAGLFNRAPGLAMLFILPYCVRRVLPFSPRAHALTIMALISARAEFPFTGRCPGIPMSGLRAFLINEKRWYTARENTNFASSYRNRSFIFPSLM